MAAMKVCVVIGIGPGNGEAFARRFAAAGYRVAMLSRTTTLSDALVKELDGAKAYVCDASDAQSVTTALEQVERDLGAVDVLVYNAGSGTWGGVDDVTPDALEQALRVNAVGSLAAAQAVLPGMRKKKSGNIVFIGATASRRGGAGTLGFAPAKAAQKSIAESLARKLGPEGIHVSLVVIDGVIDLPRTRERMTDKPQSFFLAPADIAETVHFLTEQKPSAWTFELEVRPFGEKW
jgi:NAD(P)-dependent dehydrogenase (short-subunit alcohol dehydrogenase family)